MSAALAFVPYIGKELERVSLDGLIARSFRARLKVAEILKVEFHQRVRPCSYDWMPAIDPCSPDTPCAFSWQYPLETWNILQKRLKKGTSLARHA